MAGSDFQSTWSETGTGTNDGAIATHAAQTNRLHIVTHISGNTDADATIAIRDGDETATILWAVTIDVSVNGNSFAINIPEGVYGTKGNAITGHISASTSASRVNISGAMLP